MRNSPRNPDDESRQRSRPRKEGIAWRSKNDGGRQLKTTALSIGDSDLRHDSLEGEQIDGGVVVWSNGMRSRICVICKSMRQRMITQYVRSASAKSTRARTISGWKDGFVASSKLHSRMTECAMIERVVEPFRLSSLKTYELSRYGNALLAP